MRRYLAKYIELICFRHGKMSLLSGPRQAGKTTCAQDLLSSRGNHGAYFNWDSDAFRLQWVKDPAKLIETFRGDRSAPLIIFDEIHKDRLWKRRLKGLYDTKHSPLDLLVTGSARLNVYRRGSDSLVGRAFHFNFHPLTLREVSEGDPATPEEFLKSIMSESVHFAQSSIEAIISKFLVFGTFPEPYLKQDLTFLAAWRKSRLDQIIKEDTRDLNNIQDITKLQILVDLLTERVGSLVGKASLREVLECSFDSVTRWIEILHALFVTFEVAPYSARLSRAIRRERKVYLWEISNIAEEGARFENLVALHLLKACHLWSDIGLGRYELLYVRTKDQLEIDFLITKDRKPWLPVEVKLSDAKPSPSWRKILPELGCPLALQLVRTPNVYKVFSEDSRSLVVRSAGDMLGSLI
jgi:predicted AAA+ superfamily ATPase